MMSRVDDAALDAEGVYIEFTAGREDGDGAITRCIPTTLPIPAETIESIDLDTAVLLVTSVYLSRCCKALTSLDVSPMTRLKYICNGRKGCNSGGSDSVECAGGLMWVANCGCGFDGLKRIEFVGVSSATRLPQNFMIDCPSLSSIDLSPFVNVTSVAFNFLGCNSSLISIDLSPLSNITEISMGFMAGCRALTDIDLSPLRSVACVGGSFMAHCTSLSSVDLAAFTNVTSIGSNFLYCCTSLRTVDLSPLVSLEEFDETFMFGCTALSPEGRREFMQLVKDRKPKKKAADVSARKVVVKAGCKKKK